VVQSSSWVYPGALRVADHPEVGETTQYKQGRLAVLIRTTC
jgi:hypothetical protein